MRYTVTIDLSTEVEIQRIEALYAKSSTKLRVHGVWVKPHQQPTGNVRRMIIEHLEQLRDGKGKPRPLSSAQLVRRLNGPTRTAINKNLRTMYDSEELTRVWDNKYKINRYQVTPLARQRLDEFDQARAAGRAHADQLWNAMIEDMAIGEEILIEEVVRVMGFTLVEARTAVYELHKGGVVERVNPTSKGEHIQYFKGNGAWEVDPGNL